MTDALLSAGCEILFASDPGQAPFVISFETPAGERMGIVAYAFLATRTPTKNRPPDERSFQIKYGSKLPDNEHVLWRDPTGLYTTVLLGIDPSEGFFVAADPLVHSPTKFFIRVEFKDRHADEIMTRGWYAWERDRRSDSIHAEPIEVLVGGNQKSFLDFVRFERAAVGLAPGDRHLLAERPELFTGREPIDAGVVAAIAKEIEHPLSREFELSPDQIFELIANARRLKMAVRGWVAETHLVRTLSKIPEITRCEQSDEEGGPDLLICYRDSRVITVECKNVLRKTTKEGLPRIDFQRTRASKADPCSRYYSPEDFDVVAGCLHAVSEKWEFQYVLSRELAGHAKCLGKLASNVRVDAQWSSDPLRVFGEAAS